MIHVPDFERRRDQARARAEWELGDPTWADVLIDAFLDPDTDHANLQREKEA